MRQVLLLLAAVALHSVSAIQFLVKEGEERCLSDDVGKGELLVGEFSISPPNEAVSVTVSDPTGLVVYSKTQAGDGKFAYTAATAGEYRACFIGASSGDKTISFVMRMGLETKDYSAAAKKDNLKPLEVELRRLEDTVTMIHNEMQYMKTREESMRATNDSTGTRVLWFSFFSMSILVALGISQIVYLKRYFQSRKLISVD